MEVRDATLEDVPAIHAILSHYNATNLSFDKTTPKIYELEADMKDIRNDGFPFLVVTRGGQIIGYTALRRFAANRHDTCFRFSTMLEAWVQEGELDSGAGKAMQEEMLRRLKNIRIKIVVLYMTAKKRELIDKFGLDYPELENNGTFESIVEKDGEGVDLNISQFDTGNDVLAAKL